MNIDNNTPGCINPSYNLSILDPVTMLSIYQFTSQNPSTLSQGGNAITAKFPANSILGVTNTAVVIKIETLCISGEHCVGYINAIIPPCECNYSQKASLAKIESNNISDFSIAPNPAHTEVNISYRFADNIAANSRTIQVYDAIGRPISEIKIGNAEGVYKLNVSKYAQGIYFVELRENNNHVLSKRMLINH
jgi:hypothetical protein